MTRMSVGARSERVALGAALQIALTDPSVVGLPRQLVVGCRCRVPVDAVSADRTPVAPSGSHGFTIFSGEPALLGSLGWTLDKIDHLHHSLNADFVVLERTPSIPPPAGADPLSRQHGIWSFEPILANIAPR